MNSALNTALSGLMANAKKLGVTANNIANVLTTGTVGSAPGTPGAAYTPQQTSFTAMPGGGVDVTITNADPASTPVFNPSDPNANGEGLVAMPNVSLEQEMVNQIVAEAGYKANINVIKTVQEMDKALFDIKT